EKCFKLDDGRNLCSECFQTSVLDTEKLKNIIREVQEFYMEEFNMIISLEFPILLVNRDEMKRVSRKSMCRSPFPRTDFLAPTLFWPCCFAGKVLSVQRCIVRDGNIEAQKTWKKSAKSRKTSMKLGICLLYGMSGLETATTLVLEIMHVWLLSKGVKPMEGEAVSGICQVVGHIWRERYKSSNLSDGGNSESDHRLLTLLEMRKMPRGIGFEKGMKAVEEYGLRFVLDEIVSKGKFPSTHT
ncbi:hypothetical protein Tsubulata_044755, partial [Turnera subulata]